MHSLWLYRSLSRFRLLNFRAKIMVVAFVGTHIALIAWAAAGTSATWRELLATLAVALSATLVGDGHHVVHPEPPALRREASAAA